MKTIIALSSPAGNSGVSVIRISGDKSKEILQKLIREDIDFEPRKMYLKNVYVKDFIDKSLVVFFRAPFSFTGEDIAEIQSHGGYVLAQSIIDECISLGATLAEPGEFSKRAFINGKMSLDQAEGVIDLINAESEMQLKTSSNLMQGKLTELIQSKQTQLTDILAEIEAKLDYPEYEYTDSETTNILEKLSTLSHELSTLINESKNGLIIKNGVKVAIVGSPNVGKSSLLNTLTKQEKAIVTNIAGTTRDVVEAEYEYNGIIFRLYDTAGIHESDDVVEKIGIDKAYKTLNECDIVLKISDAENICDIETEKPYINVFNKIDLLSNTTSNIDEILKNTKNELLINYFNQNKNNLILISAKDNKNIDTLKQRIFDMTVSENINQNKIYLTNTRHIECVKSAKQNIENAINLFSTTTMDIISLEIKSAWSVLGEITGVTSDEAIIDKIFSKFCLGK